MSLKISLIPKDPNVIKLRRKAPIIYKETPSKKTICASIYPDKDHPGIVIDVDGDICALICYGNSSTGIEITTWKQGKQMATHQISFDE